jgi:hypothetical protein
MSHTDKTDPHRVKVARYGEDYSQPIHHCGCWSCRGAWLTQARREERTRRRAAVRTWQRDYEPQR